MWALTLDGLRFQSKPLMSEENGCCMDNTIKILLLRKLFKNNYGGGIVKSAEEEWQYNSDGSVNCLIGQHKLHYTWTGEFLQPSLGPEIINFGTGKWDGINLWWFPPSSDSNGIKNILGNFYYSRNPIYHYLFSPIGREYLSNDSKKEWKWSRHFLASKEGEKEWILEGDIPPPVVMLLQLMRYFINDSSLKKIKFDRKQSDDMDVSPQLRNEMPSKKTKIRRKSYQVTELKERKIKGISSDGLRLPTNSLKSEKVKAIRKTSPRSSLHH